MEYHTLLRILMVAFFIIYVGFSLIIFRRMKRNIKADDNYTAKILKFLIPIIIGLIIGLSVMPFIARLITT